MVNQEPNQETLFLVGSWLRPEDFGFGHPLYEAHAGLGLELEEKKSWIPDM